MHGVILLGVRMRPAAPSSMNRPSKHATSRVRIAGPLRRPSMMSVFFTLLADSVQFDEAQGVCQGVADDFETLRCPSALLDTSECYTRESNDCQANCGNWHKCNCWKSRGFPGEPDQCEGETELLRLDGTPDNCDGISRMCFNHRPSTLCGKYKHCPANICIITGKTCPLTDPCQDVGVCAPGDGQCYYSTLPDGTPCTDGKDYTHTDTCQNAVCTGIEDKCVRFDVKCNTPQ